MNLAMDAQRRQWLEVVASAARQAADDLRGLDDPRTESLRADLDDLHRRLTAELKAADDDT